MERIKQNEIPAGLFKAMLQVSAYVTGSGLEAGLLELINTRVSQINGCAYCLDMHTKDAVAAGETWQRLVSLSAWRDAPYYTGKERAVLAYAERLTYIHQEHEEHTLHEGLDVFFSKAEIANLTLAIASINSWNRLVKSFGTVAGTYTVGQHKQ